MALLNQTVAFLTLSFLCLSTCTESRTWVVHEKQIGLVALDAGNATSPAKLPIQNGDLDAFNAGGQKSNTLPVENTFLASAPSQEVGPETWCIIKPSTPFLKLESFIANLCSNGAECSIIQAGGTCYNSLNEASDASVLANQYYKYYNSQPEACYFEGYGMIVSVDPSVFPCIYP